MSLEGFKPMTSCTVIPHYIRLAVAANEIRIPHPVRLHTVRHSPHYIAEITFQNVEPTEFVF